MRTLLLAISLMMILLPTANSSAGDTTWQARGDGYEPFAPEELLAVRMMKSGAASINEPPYLVEIEDEDDDGTIVKVVKSSPGDNGMQYVYRFKMQESRLVAATTPSFHQVFDDRRLQHAREIAQTVIDGKAPARPEIYDGYLYKTRIGSKCHVEVDEYNTEREFQQTYEFNVCQ